MLVDRALQDFVAACSSANNFVSRAHTQDARGHFHLTESERELVTVAAFLRLFISWETFLENTFLLYMLGNPTRLGANIRTFVVPNDLEHATSLLLGAQRQKFIDWSTPDTLRNLAPIIFEDGKPFLTAINGCHAQLLDMKTVRNATAHSTSTTKRALNSLASRMLNHSITNITPAEFLLSIQPSSHPSKTIMESYIEVLQLAAQLIAEG